MDDILKLMTTADERNLGLIDALPNLHSRIPFVNAGAMNGLVIARKTEYLEHRMINMELMFDTIF